MTKSGKQLGLKVKGLRESRGWSQRECASEAVGVIEAFTSLERNLASIADDTAVSKPSRPVPFLSPVHSPHLRSKIRLVR